MRIVIDRHIPYLAEVLAPYAEVQAVEPEAVTPALVREADALVVRTRTRVDADLLAGSRVRMVATATIGYDHIDTDWCESHGVAWGSCPGCNAQAVCDYIEEVLEEMHVAPDATIGVVGVGHVGSRVADMAGRRGMTVLLCDPPKGIGVSREEVADRCDIITFHTPLTGTGPHPTYHLCDEAFLRRCKPQALIINAARGGVVDEQALLDSGRPFVLDTWENEPHLRPEVLRRAALASMHIAGYSAEGKRNASQMCLDALCAFFGLPACVIDEKAVPLYPNPHEGDSAPGWIGRITSRLKASPADFEQLRKNYKLR